MKKKNDTYKLVIGLISGFILSLGAIYAEIAFQANAVSYNISNTTINSTDVQGAIDELANKYATLTQCPEEMVCEQMKTTLALGDYVKYYSSTNRVVTDMSKTGNTVQQVIYPQELLLWRVLNINQDGTVDIISENVSSVDVTFSGETGYRNLVGYLNELASEYENSTYTTGSRYFGYNGQTEYITGTLDSSAEETGGGDELYTTDFNQTNTALGTRVAKNLSGTAKAYWMASRYFSSSYYYGRNVNARGGASNNNLFNASGTSYSYSYALRPIVTLKSGLSYLGMGTADYPMEIQKNNS